MSEKFLNAESLPSNWLNPKLEEVAEIVMGQSPPSSTYNVEGKGLPFFQGKGEFTDLYPVVKKWCSEPNRIAEPNDILISVRAPVGATNIANQKCCIGRGLAAVRYSPQYKFLFYYLRLIEKKLDEKGTGTTFRAISGEVLKETDFPFPPLPEQHRIVEKIEALFSELENGIQQLTAAQQQLKVYRQAVLKWAFEGKLTEEWRSMQNEKGKIQKAKELLTRIKHEREAQSKISGKKLKPIAPLTERELIELPELPTGWSWVRLYEVAESSLGKMLDQQKNKGILLPYLRNINVRWGSFDVHNLAEMRVEESESERFGLRNGDLIVCEGGEPGRCAIWRNQVPNMKIQKALHRVRFVDAVKAEYFFYHIFLSTKTNSLEEHFTGTTIKHLTGESLNAFPLPLCSSHEQDQIVQEIESRLSVCDKLEETIAASLHQAEALRQSILKKAFEGKLVEQDPKDEPAGVVVERIKAEREKQPEKKNKEARRADMIIERTRKGNLRTPKE